MDEAQDDKVVGVDATVIAAPDARKLAEKIKANGGNSLVAVDENRSEGVV